MWPPIETGGVPAPPPGEPAVIENCQPGNAAGMTDAQVQAARAAGPATGVRFLYPYDQTVFPRGMIAPLLMWEGATPSALYVHITASEFDYEGCVLPTGVGQLQFDQNMWNLAGEKSKGGSDPFKVEVAFVEGGNVRGKLEMSFVIARATVKGSIYYNSYVSRFASQFGAVLRIPAGREVEPFASLECTGCHSVSADGSRLIAQTLATGARAFALTPGIQPNPPAMTPGPRAAYGALYPDGSRFLTTSTMLEVARTALTSPAGNPSATLIETDTGAVLPSQGIPAGAMMPAFSPDGTLLAYTDFDTGAGQGLALARFDGGTNTASGNRILFTDSGTTKPAWPFFLPDNQGLIIQRTDSGDFSGGAAGLVPGVSAGPYGELFFVDVATGKSTIMAQAMGYRTEADVASRNTYLPFGEADLAKVYFPTVSPVAAGGYFWVFFDALRNYGNMGLQRQLWGAAVDIAADGSYTIDRSHPAFYLPGQEFGTGNHRAFAALDPCRGDGDSCTSGIDCCGGFCDIPEDPAYEFGSPVGTCTSAPPACAKADEQCSTDADCCLVPGQLPLTCIAGFCALPALQ